MGILSRLFKRDGYYSTKPNGIRFHGEQNGEVEREITKLWCNTLINHREISEAYLAIATVRPKDEPHPTLCLYTTSQNDSDKQKVITDLSEDFKSLFNSSQFLDIIFLTNEMRVECAEVCPPFFQQ